LYSSPSIVEMIKSRRMKWARHVPRMGGGERNPYTILVGKPEGNRPLGRLRRRQDEDLLVTTSYLQHDGERCGTSDASISEIENLLVSGLSQKISG
jgi:hypothetical protein